MKYQNFDYYKVLGVDRSANTFQIKKAYLAISKAYHPDKCFTHDEQQKYNTLKESEKEGKELSEQEKKLLDKLEEKIRPFCQAAIAYKTLLDENEKKKYDMYKSGPASDPGKKNGCGKKEETKKSYQATKTNKKKDIESNFLEALHYKNFKKAKALVRELINLGRLYILLPMLHSFIKNANESDDWCEFFEEILSYKKIDLETTSFDVDGTPLQYACYLNKRKAAELLLKNGANVNKTNLYGKKMAPICYALEHNNHDLVNLLFQYGAKIDVSYEDEQAIIANSHLYNKKTMEALLQRTSPKQNTQIFKRLFENKAPTDEDNEILKLLLDKGVDLIGVRLYEAISNLDLKTARELIKEIESSSTCFTNDPEILGYLVENACRGNDWLEFCKDVLLKLNGKKIDLNNIYIRGLTVLECACMSGKKDVAKLLLDNGADVNNVSDVGRTAIFCALQRVVT